MSSIGVFSYICYGLKGDCKGKIFFFVFCCHLLLLPTFFLSNYLTQASLNWLLDWLIFGYWNIVKNFLLGFKNALVGQSSYYSVDCLSHTVVEYFEGAALFSIWLALQPKTKTASSSDSAVNQLSSWTEDSVAHRVYIDVSETLWLK